MTPPTYAKFRNTAAGLLAALGAAGATQAADMALVVSGSGPSSAHEARVRAYSEAGYDVFEGRGLDRAGLVRLLGRFEAELDTADRLILHLTGPMDEAGGVAVYLPEEPRDDSVVALLTDGVPLGLIMELAAERPGESLVALGRVAATDVAPLRLDPPDGVAVLRGAPDPVSNIVTGVLVAAGLPPTAIDTAAAGVAFEGDVSPGLRFGRMGAAAPASADPAEQEAALALSIEARREIQRDLTALGYNTRGIDGIFGPGTRGAIREWEARAGLSPNGYLAGPEIARLAEDAATLRAEQEARERADREAWDRARFADEIPAYQTYLDRFPEGLYRARAEERVAALEVERADRRAWRAAEDADSVAGYRRYLREHPEGQFAERARDRIVALGGEVEDPSTRAEREAWARARETDSIAAYRDFLDEYPRGENARRAEARIAEIERETSRFQAAEQGLGLNTASLLLIEARLALLGIDPGRVDGRLDERTRAAIARFQDQRGLTASGYLDEATMQRLVGGR